LRLPPDSGNSRRTAWQETHTYPSEELVIRLAAEWSLDPSTINKREAAAGLGYLGRAPARWRLKRIPMARRALGI
jgi:hypothetical protein